MIRALLLVVVRRWLAPDDGLTDVIAYLRQRRDNAEAMATQSVEFADWGRDRMRQIDVILTDLQAGLHIGSAAVRARLSPKAEA